MRIIENAIEFIRKKPKMFVRLGTAKELASGLVGDVLLLSGGPVTAVINGDFWIVGSEHDWLTKSGYSIHDIFHQIIPFPEAGQNCHHSEVLLNAYCEDVICVGTDGVRIIKGKSDREDMEWSSFLNQNGGKRLVAFRLVSCVSD